MNVKSIKKYSDEMEDENEGLRSIVTALECLTEEARCNGYEDVSMVIDATFKICLSMYYLQERGEYVSSLRLDTIN